MAILSKIINSITDLNNLYRDSHTEVKLRLEALWEIGNCLKELGVKKPHSMGWKIQKETKGLIKRPTIFRAYKIRQIWGKKDDMMRDVGELKRVSSLIEMLPFIDPKQEVRGKLSDRELIEIYENARKFSGKNFTEYLLSLKTKYSHGRLGKSLDKSKHLQKFEEVIKYFRELQDKLIHLFKDLDRDNRDIFRSSVQMIETRSFSNMCLSLTTKNNFKLYKKLGPEESESTDESFIYLYNCFKGLLSKANDIERARLRRLISAEAFAQLSDMISSIQSEALVKDFKVRQKLSIGL
ncbi:MAG: hypothetical protein GY858_09455 [Candidatus Omnitrophica bacterium]|nr:hypothetical protein [Candidatus Omnitrophota bacterium]